MALALITKLGLRIFAGDRVLIEKNRLIFTRDKKAWQIEFVGQSYVDLIKGSETRTIMFDDFKFIKTSLGNETFELTTI